MSDIKLVNDDFSSITIESTVRKIERAALSNGVNGRRGKKFNVELESTKCGKYVLNFTYTHLKAEVPCHVSQYTFYFPELLRSEADITSGYLIVFVKAYMMYISPLRSIFFQKHLNRATHSELIKLSILTQSKRLVGVH